MDFIPLQKKRAVGHPLRPDESVPFKSSSYSAFLSVFSLPTASARLRLYAFDSATLGALSFPVLQRFAFARLRGPESQLTCPSGEAPAVFED